MISQFTLTLIFSIFLVLLVEDGQFLIFSMFPFSYALHIQSKIRVFTVAIVDFSLDFRFPQETIFFKAISTFLPFQILPFLGSEFMKVEDYSKVP